MDHSNDSPPSETIIEQRRPSFFYYYKSFIFATVICMVAVSVGRDTAGVIVFVIIGCFLFVTYLRLRFQYTVTTQRVYMREGIVARNTREIRVSHIRALNVHQGFFDRIFGVGSIVINSVADGGAEVVFVGVADPHGMKERIYNLTLNKSL